MFGYFSRKNCLTSRNEIKTLAFLLPVYNNIILKVNVT